MDNIHPTIKTFPAACCICSAAHTVAQPHTLHSWNTQKPKSINRSNRRRPENVIRHQSSIFSRQKRDTSFFSSIDYVSWTYHFCYYFCKYVFLKSRATKHNYRLSVLRGELWCLSYTVNHTVLSDVLPFLPKHEYPVTLISTVPTRPVSPLTPLFPSQSGTPVSVCPKQNYKPSAVILSAGNRSSRERQARNARPAWPPAVAAEEPPGIAAAAPVHDGSTIYSIRCSSARPRTAGPPGRQPALAWCLQEEFVLAAAALRAGPAPPGRPPRLSGPGGLQSPAVAASPSRCPGSPQPVLRLLDETLQLLLAELHLRGGHRGVRAGAGGGTSARSRSQPQPHLVGRLLGHAAPHPGGAGHRAAHGGTATATRASGRRAPVTSRERGRLRRGGKGEETAAWRHPRAAGRGRRHGRWACPGGRGHGRGGRCPFTGPWALGLLRLGDLCAIPGWINGINPLRSPSPAFKYSAPHTGSRAGRDLPFHWHIPAVIHPHEKFRKALFCYWSLHFIQRKQTSGQSQWQQGGAGSCEGLHRSSCFVPSYTS